MANEYLSGELFSSTKVLAKEIYQRNFFLKMVLLFCLYTFTNYVFDRVDHEDLVRTFHQSPHINIRLPKNTTFKLLIILLMIISSHFFYVYLLKPIVYKKD
jgi:hypothetical protein